MIQKLIVEGDNDIHLITRLCLAKGIKAIKGYENQSEYIRQFVSKAGGKEEVKRALRFQLEKEETNNQANVGVVIDADSETENPAIDTWLSIRHILSEFGYKNLPKKPNPQGTIIVQEDKAKIGVWIMPNNVDAGYLEHFFQDLILEKDEFLVEAAHITEGFISSKRNRFSQTAKSESAYMAFMAGKTRIADGFCLKRI